MNTDKKFNTARGNLAHSQGILDSLHQLQTTPIPPHTPPQEPGMPQAAPIQPEQVPQPDIQKTIQDTLTPFMDKITSLLTKQENEVKQVELKIDGQMTPQ